MACSQLILPRADAECGKAFFEERRIADDHRIALEFWNRATGHFRNGFHLAVYRCKRCGGFHIGQKRINKHRGLIEVRGSRHGEHPNLAIPEPVSVPNQLAELS